MTTAILSSHRVSIRTFPTLRRARRLHLVRNTHTTVNWDTNFASYGAADAAADAVAFATPNGASFATTDRTPNGLSDSPAIVRAQPVADHTADVLADAPAIACAHTITYLTAHPVAVCAADCLANESAVTRTHTFADCLANRRTNGAADPDPEPAALVASHSLAVAAALVASHGLAVGAAEYGPDAAPESCAITVADKNVVSISRAFAHTGRAHNRLTLGYRVVSSAIVVFAHAPI